jgi:hypothetical protein
MFVSKREQDLTDKHMFSKDTVPQVNFSVKCLYLYVG